MSNISRKKFVSRIKEDSYNVTRIKSEYLVKKVEMLPEYISNIYTTNFIRQNITNKKNEPWHNHFNVLTHTIIWCHDFICVTFRLFSQSIMTLFS